MTIDELRKLLTTDIVTVTFTKKNGDKREMICTTVADLLPMPEAVTANIAKPSEHVVTVWDLEQAGWRSFRFDSVTSIETDYFNYVVES